MLIGCCLLVRKLHNIALQPRILPPAADAFLQRIFFTSQPVEFALQLRLLLRQLPELLISGRLFVRKVADLTLQLGIRFDQLAVLFTDRILFVHQPIELALQLRLLVRQVAGIARRRFLFIRKLVTLTSGSEFAFVSWRYWSSDRVFLSAKCRSNSLCNCDFASANSGYCSSAAAFPFASWPTSICSRAFASDQLLVLFANRVFFIRQPADLALKLNPLLNKCRYCSSSGRFFIRNLAQLVLQPVFAVDQLPMLFFERRKLSAEACRFLPRLPPDVVQLVDLRRKLADLEAKLLVPRSPASRGFDPFGSRPTADRALPVRRGNFRAYR